MEKQLLIPMIVYVLYMNLLAILNFFARKKAIQQKQIPVGFFKTYQGEVPERVIVVGRHYDNQFQVPVIFLLGGIAHLALKQTDTLTVTLAWLFVFTRIGHAFEHLGRNHVLRRALWFASGWFFVSVLWLQLLLCC